MLLREAEARASLNTQEVTPPEQLKTSELLLSRAFFLILFGVEMVMLK